jgi:hypothetical protein
MSASHDFSQGSITILNNCHACTAETPFRFLRIDRRWIAWRELSPVTIIQKALKREKVPEKEGN